MSTVKYNKLVRDKIPHIIRKNGEIPKISYMAQDEFISALEMKLDEEVAEYHRDKNINELADILEVVFALSSNLGYTKEELMAQYEKKHNSNGGFEEKIFLISKEVPEE